MVPPSLPFTSAEHVWLCCLVSSIDHQTKLTRASGPESHYLRGSRYEVRQQDLPQQTFSERIKPAAMLPWFIASALGGDRFPLRRSGAVAMIPFVCPRLNGRSDSTTPT